MRWTGRDRQRTAEDNVLMINEWILQFCVLFIMRWTTRDRQRTAEDNVLKINEWILQFFLMTSESRHWSCVARCISGMIKSIRRPCCGVIAQVHSMFAGYSPGQFGLWINPRTPPVCPRQVRSVTSKTNLSTCTTGIRLSK